MPPGARDIKERINKWDFITIKSAAQPKKIQNKQTRLCQIKKASAQLKKTSAKIKREPNVWKNIFANEA